MIHVVVMKRLIGLPLLMHILWRSRSFKNWGVGGFVYRLHSPVLNQRILPVCRLKICKLHIQVTIQSCWYWRAHSTAAHKLITTGPPRNISVSRVIVNLQFLTAPSFAVDCLNGGCNRVLHRTAYRTARLPFPCVWTRRIGKREAILAAPVTYLMHYVNSATIKM
jgi:hypothetical protein